MITCRFCGYEGTVEDGEFEMDQYEVGAWCEVCDGYNYIKMDIVHHRFTLILEDKHGEPVHVPKPDVSLSKRLSPYRYPGGKTKLIEYLYAHLQKTKSKHLVSPFSGGGSFELAMLEAGVVETLHLNDLDTGVFSFWWAVRHMPDMLIDRILSSKPNRRDYFEAQALIKNDYRGVDVMESAWASLLVNRLAYSGIVKANPLGGKKGTEDLLLSRWNPKELVRRIQKIHRMGDRITITQENAVQLIEEAYWRDDATIFIDPPYVEKGKDLYHCFYTEKHHKELSVTLESLHACCPGADIVVTYDYNKWLEDLYDVPEKEVIGRTYSI